MWSRTRQNVAVLSIYVASLALAGGAEIYRDSFTRRAPDGLVELLRSDVRAGLMTFATVLAGATAMLALLAMKKVEASLVFSMLGWLLTPTSLTLGRAIVALAFSRELFDDARARSDFANWSAYSSHWLYHGAGVIVFAFALALAVISFLLEKRPRTDRRDDATGVSQ